MRRTFVALNLALAAVATLLIVYIARQFIAPMPLPVGGRRAATAGSAAVTDPPRPPASAYNVVAARNLFSPTRTEAPTSGAVATTPLLKPNLFGVVVRESGSIAYLEDPKTQRVAGYRVGDPSPGRTPPARTVRGETIHATRGAMHVRRHAPG